MNPTAALYLGRRIPGGLPDPLGEAWWVSWAGHALLHQPAAFFQANSSWPDADALARIDSLAGYAPAGVFAHTWTGLLAVYGLLFLLATALAFGGTFLLARVLGLARGPSLVAALAFACAPYRLAQNGHLYMLSTGGIPLALALLLLGYRRRSARFVIAGWLVVAWQVSLSFSVGLQLMYLLLVLAAGAAVWAYRTRPALPPAPVRFATIGGIAVVAAVALTLAMPYVRVLHSQPTSPSSSLPAFSSQPRSFLIPPSESSFYRYRAAEQRLKLSAPDEQSLYPGIAIVALALVGIALGPWPRRSRFALGVAALWLAYASLGVVFLDGFGGYGIVRHLPGFTGVRVPGRLMTSTTLALALLAGLGAAALLRLGTTPRVRVLILGLTCAAVVAEGYGPATTWAPFRPGIADSQLPGPVMHLPAAAPFDPLYQFWSATQGFPRIVNGAGGTVTPATLLRRYRATDDFPSRQSIAYLRALGVKTVVLHPYLSLLGPWKDAEKRTVAGLGIERRREGRDYVYSLDG